MKKVLRRMEACFIVGCFLMVLTAPAVGQVPPRPLRDVQVRARVHLDESTGVYWYEYEVTNPASNELEISIVAIDISAPSQTALCCWETLPHQERMPPHNVVWRPPTAPSIPGGDPNFTAERLVESEYKMRLTPVGPFAPPDWAFGAGSPTMDSLLQVPSLHFSTTGVPETYWQGNPIRPGMTLGGFKMTSFYPPTIRAIAFQPDKVPLLDADRIPEEWLTDYGDSMEVVRWKKQQIASLGYKTETIGPGVLTVAGSALAGLLRDYVHRSEGLRWVLDPAYAADLRNRLERIRTLLEQEKDLEAEVELIAFLERVDGARPDQQRPEAWGLLYYNGRILLEQVRQSIPILLEVRPGKVERMSGQEAEFTVTAVQGTRRVAGLPVHVWVEGPHEGLSWDGVTDGSGQFVIRYRGRRLGLDRVLACRAYDAGGCGEVPEAVMAYADWTGGPDLVIGVLVPRMVRLPVEGNVLRIREATANIGVVDARPSTTRYYLSVDEVRDDTDRVLGERRVEPLAVQTFSEGRVELPVPGDLGPGVYHVIACADADGEVGEMDETNNCEPLIAVLTPVMKREENRPPGCTRAGVEPGSLWPPNHTMRDIAITGVTDPDGDPVTIQATGVKADEPVDVQGGGDGNTCPDATVSPLRVRAERQGAGDGRVYHVEFRADDGKGGVCTGVVRVCVPHDRGQGSQCGDGGPQHDVTVCPP